MLPIIRSILAISAFGLVACGGSGGDKKTPPVVAPSSTPSSTQSSIPTTSSSPSSISSMPSSSASSVALTKLNGTIKGISVNGTQINLDDQQTKINVYLLDKDEKILANQKPVPSTHSSSDDVRFSVDLNTPGTTSIAVTVSHPGYTSFSRKYEAKPQIVLEAQLHAVPVVTVVPDTSTSISGVAVNGFNIAVNSDDDATQSDSISIQIPSSLLPDGTSSLDVAVRTFDPNDKDDALLFPGAYADSDGNELASVAFNYASVNTDSGEPLVAAMQKARQQKIAKAGGAQKLAAEEPVVINRQIPEQSCRLLESLGDSAADIPGFQVPVYTYNSSSGLWDLLGQGTIYTADGQQVAATQSTFNCATANFYLEILVTNEIFLSDWWNLDYPLLFSQPTTYCAQIQVKNPEGQLLSGLTGFVMDSDDTFNFASTYVTTDAEGKASIRVTQSSIAPDLSAEVIFYNATEFGYIEKTITLSTDCTTTTPQVIEVVRPKLCEVSGKFIYDDGKPVTRNLVYGFTEDEDESFWNFDFASSNEQGVYRLNLPCGGSYEIFDFATSMTSQAEEISQFTRIDANLDADESSDDGNSVVMKQRTITLGQPPVYGIYDVTTDRLTLTAYSTFDAFPMNAQIIVKSADGTVTHQTFAGTFNADTFSDNELTTFYFGGSLEIDTVLPDSEGYRLEITVTNALGKTWEKIPGFVSTRMPQ